MRFIRRLFWNKNDVEFIMLKRIKDKKVLSIQTKCGKRTNFTHFKKSWKFHNKFTNQKQKSAIKEAMMILGKKKFWRRP